MYTLCVIDMQQYFLNNGNDVSVEGVAREIRQAIKDDADILFVEYQGCGDTVPNLTDLVKHLGSTKVHKVVKSGDDGSEDIMEKINREDLKSDHLKVVGVNTDCCVYRTVSGLKFRYPESKIEVVADACHSNWGPDSHINGLQLIKSLGCVVTNGELFEKPTAIVNPYEPSVKSIGDPF